jgi:hypothetical protein
VSAHRSVEEVQLEGYYVAALAFIDPQLDLSAELEAVETAARQHHRELSELPAHLAAADLEQLAEAMEFVRRYHDRFAQVAEAGGHVPSIEAPAELDPATLGEFTTAVPDQANGNGHTNGNGHSNGNSHASWVVVDEEAAAPVAVAVETAVETPLPTRRHSPLRRLWDEPASVVERSDELVEVRTLPLLRGFALLAYEAWLVVYAGWVATRFRAWPHEPLTWDMTLAGHGLFILGALTSAVAAWGIYRYRTATRNIAALVHGGAALIALNLLAWHIEVGRDTLPRIPGPGSAHWEVLIIGWLVCSAAVHIIDLRRASA